MKTIDLQEDISLQIYITMSTEDLWAKYVLYKYIKYKTLAIKLTTMFNSTYICETLFPKITFLKNKYRSRLTDLHLENTLCISCSPRVPNFKKLTQDKICLI